MLSSRFILLDLQAPKSILSIGLILYIIFTMLFAHLIFLGDDCYISFRYAQNLIHGYGLVWNEGEYVEGYTHLLWVLWIALTMYLGIMPETSVIFTGYLCGLAVLILMFRWSYIKQKHSTWILWFIPAALICNRSFVAWCSGGLATMLFTLLLLLAYLSYIKEDEEKSLIPWISSTFFAIAELTRPEAGIFMCATGFCFLYQVLRKNRSWKSLVLWCMPFIIIVGGHFLWRYYYYNAWLPNTFHAKVHGAWWEQSLQYFMIFAEEYHLHYSIPFVVCASWRSPKQWHAPLWFGLTLYMTYIGYVGADRFEFRFLVVILPLYLILVQDALVFYADLLTRLSPKQYQYGLAIILLTVSLVGSTHPLGWSRSYKRAYHHRWKNAHVASLPRIKYYANMRVEQGQRLHYFVQQQKIPMDFKISTGGAGALPFYSQLWTLDYYGLNDSHIARKEVKSRGLIGHETHASINYMQKRGVEAYAILKRFIYAHTDKEYQHLVQDAYKKIAKLNQESIDQGNQAKLHYQCYQLTQNEHFIFATPQDPQKIRTRLSKLVPCI